MSGSPDVTVIIPYYNHGRYLHAAVQSALAATRRTVEVLVVNDGSPEAGAQAFLDAAQALSPCVRVIAKPNGGLSSARNMGLDHARGAFIQFLDSDDVLYRNKIDLQIEHLFSRPALGASICHYALGDTWLVDLDATYDSIGRFPLTPASFLLLWERGFSVPIHCGLFRRRILETLRFDTSVAGKEDWIFWTELLDNQPDALGYLPVLGAVYRMHGDGMTRSMAIMARSFESAAEQIGQRWRDRYPTFDADAKRWLRKFYQPQIERERLLMSLERPATARRPAPAPSPQIASTAAPRPVGLRTAASSPSGRARLDVVTPVFNHFDYLESCIGSVLSQREIGRMIIVDDASSDQRVQPFLEAWASQEPRLTYVRNPVNSGISASQNLGVSLSHAEFIGFVDCDDHLAPGAAARILSQMEREPADYYFTDRTDIDEHDRPIRVARYGGYPWLMPSGSIERDLTAGMVASHWKVIRRASYEALGGSDSAMSGIQDWTFALEACGRLRFSYLPEPLYNHRIHSSSVTSGHQLAQTWKSNVARRRHMARLRPSSGQIALVSALGDHTDVLDLINRVMTHGERIAFDDNGRDLAISEIDLLREFNSLFEMITIGENAAVALSGYLWDHHVVEISNSVAARMTVEE